MTARTVTEGHCPFCGRLQVPEATEHWRCPACNLFITAGQLVGPGAESALDGTCRDFCPWCAFPMAREFSLPEDEEFACVGCGGTLSVGLLETQAALEQYRKKRMSGAGFLAFALVLLLCILAALWVLGG